MGTNDASPADPAMPGVRLKVQIDGKEMVIRPLTCHAVRALTGHAAKIRSGEATELQAMDMMLDLVHASLARAQPEFTRESLETALDLLELKTLGTKVMEISGLEVADPNATSP